MQGPYVRAAWHIAKCYSKWCHGFDGEGIAKKVYAK